MDRDPEEKNLFETASETLGSKKGKKKPDGKQDGGPLTPVADVDVTKRQQNPIKKLPQDPELKEMVGKIKTMQDDLKSRFDKLYQETGMDADQLKTYMENPKNFMPADWEYLQKNKQVLENRVWDAVGQELKPSHEKTIRTRANIADERKGKTLGSRKKWLPMR